MARTGYIRGLHEDLGRLSTARGGSDRAFGLVLAGVLSIVAILPWIRGGLPRPWALVAGGVLLLIALIRPRLLHVANILWTRVGLLLSRITTPLFTAILLYVVFTPVAFVMRLAGRDVLGRRFDPAARSYWIPRVPPGPDAGNMPEQY